MKFRMKDFRRFHNTGDVEIKPITVLIGENSSGKSSFLSGLRFMIDSISIKGEGSFNREPFFMGAFDQIAHYRGGRFGRAKSFELGLTFEGNELEEIVGDVRARYGFSMPDPKFIGSSQVHLTFENDQSQPILSRVRLQSSRNRLLFERKQLPRFSFQELSSRQPTHLRQADEADLRVLRSGMNNRLSLQFFYQVANDWAFRKYREFSRSEEQTEDSVISQKIIESSYGVFALGPQAVYAAAPFRTKPERTYSPVEATSSAEGAHIPILLAQTKSFEKNRWNIIKDKLESFGQSSGMFKKIDIKRLGKLDSDPFQLVITVSKDKSNIVDVGYGVSQILPLIVETIVNVDAAFFFFQQPEVHLHPRGQAELGSYFVDFCLSNNKRVIIETHSDYIIDRLRNDLVRRNLDPNKYLSLLYFEKDEFETRIRSIKMDENGSIIDPPESYRQFFLEESIRSLGL